VYSTAQGNVLADYFATKAHTATNLAYTRTTSLPWTLTINDEVIGGSIHKQLKTAIFQPVMTQRWAKTLRIPESCHQLCDWTTFYQNLESTPSNARHWLTKFNNRLLPVGKNLKQRRHCPCCGEDEDHNHIISCQHTLMSQTFDELYSEVQTLLNQSAAPGIENEICLLLRIFRDPTTVPTNTEELGSSIQGQLQLGQGAFFAGLWIRDWIQRQEIFHQQLRTPRTAQRWIVSLIQKIQQIPKAMWTVRNQILHKNMDTHTLQHKHDELDNLIDDIYLRKPHQRCMAHCDNQYFSKHTRTQLKNMKIHRKTNWITGATIILTKYERSTTLQSARFTSYFQWDNG
jgi:hypothetical protein